MNRLRLDDVRQALPPLEELRPILDFLLARSEPDPARAWAGSGELGTVGERFVPAGAVSAAAEALAAEAQRGLLAVFRVVGDALQRLEEGDGVGAATAFLEAAALEEGRDRPERARAYAAAAHRALAGAREPSATALALRRWGRAALACGRMDEARARYEEAYELAGSAGDARGAAEAAIGAGNVLERQGRWRPAEGWYRRALQALEPLADPGPELWHALLNVHIVLRSGGALPESLPWLERAERVAAELGDAAAVAFLENARGQLDMGRGAFGAAEEHLRRALDHARGTRVVVTIRLNLAEALLAQGRTLDAAEAVREAEREALAGGLSSKLPEIYRLLGRITASEGNPDAFVLFERSLQMVAELGLPALEEALTLQAYAQAERRRGEVEAGDRLLVLARERFAALGITHVRHAWTDYYGPDPRGESAAHGERGHDDG
jgi:tetratricopeptide (TPR) repeat protein